MSLDSSYGLIAVSWLYTLMVFIVLHFQKDLSNSSKSHRIKAAIKDTLMIALMFIIVVIPASVFFNDEYLYSGIFIAIIAFPLIFTISAFCKFVNSRYVVAWLAFCFLTPNLYATFVYIRAKGLDSWLSSSWSKMYVAFEIPVVVFSPAHLSSWAVHFSVWGLLFFVWSRLRRS